MSRPCPPVIPGTYNGRVTIDGRPAPDGTPIWAVIGDMLWGLTETKGGRYVATVPETMPTREPCFPNGGAIVFITEGDLTARESPLWLPGLHDVDLTFESVPSQRDASWDASRAYADVKTMRDWLAHAAPPSPRPPPSVTGPMTVSPVFRGRGFAVDEQLCFVLMPFADELRPIYDDHIRKVVEGCGLQCVRADDVFAPGQIMEQIWEQMNCATLIVADVSGKNPNVFYELGIAHTLGKPVILITRSQEDVPFDLRHLRFIQYEYTPRGCQDLERKLREAIQAVVGSARG